MRESTAGRRVRVVDKLQTFSGSADISFPSNCGESTEKANRIATLTLKPFLHLPHRAST